MEKKDLRMRLNKDFQRKLFLKLYKKFGTITNSANVLGISRACYCNYHYCINRHIPISVIERLIKILKVNKNTLDKNTEEIIDLDGIRIKYSLSKTYDVLKSKYGKDWTKRLREKSELIWREKYGEDWHNIISKMGLNALREKYGPDWNKLIRSKARDELIKKFGEDWGKILNRKAMASLEKKYGKGFHFQLYQMSRSNLKVPLTNLENRFKQLLEKKGIKHETHIRNNEIEFDFIIPTFSNPLIICEISNMKPTTNSIRFKIAEMLVQKSYFQNSHYFCVLKETFEKKKGKHYFNPDLGKYLLDKDIIIFWSDELQELTKIIENILNEKQTTGLNRVIERRRHEFELRLGNFSRFSSHGLSIAKLQIGNGEKKFNKLLLMCGANPRGPTVFPTKYGGTILTDNYEECNGTKIVYEVTNAKQQRALASLAGKLAYQKDSCGVKTVAIVRNMRENWGLRWLKLLSDKVITLGDKSSLISTRKELLGNI